MILSVANAVVLAVRFQQPGRAEQPKRWEGRESCGNRTGRSVEIRAAGSCTNSDSVEALRHVGSPSLYPRFIINNHFLLP